MCVFVHVRRSKQQNIEQKILLLVLKFNAVAEITQRSALSGVTIHHAVPTQRDVNADTHK